MTLQQQVVKEISSLSEEDLTQVIQFVNFLQFSKSGNSFITEHPADEKKFRARGGLSGKVVLADDFHETPDCFEEYV